MKRVLFRGDDLGYSEGVNYGIEKAIREGLIRSQGVMVNMPATEHGVQLVNGFDIAFGVHTNICNGKPLTNPKYIPSLVDDNGNFKSSKAYRSSKEDFVVLDEVLLEIEAQYHKFVALFNRKPDYFEGHAVASPNFFKGLEYIAHKYQLTYSGLPAELATPIQIGNSLVRMNMESMLPDYDPFEMVQKAVAKMTDDVVELFVFHPGYLDADILEHSSLTLPRPQEVAMLTRQETKAWLEKAKVHLITYRNL